jgi:hypothetical protein
MYRQQFLEYLDRYSNTEQRDTSISSVPTRLPQDNEWFRKPATPIQSQSTSFSSQNFEADENIGKTRQEGESYLSTPCVRTSEGFTILGWWKANEAVFPHLARVAKDVLAIPISEVGVERVFNTSKDVIGDRRHRLSSQTVRKIMIMKDAIFQDEQDDTPATPPGDDEVDDLLELAACSEGEDGVNEVDVDAVEENLPAAAEREARESRPRKRVKPIRYRDDVE